MIKDNNANSASDLDFDEISVGDSISVERTFDDEDVSAFAALSGDYSPLHMKEEYAAGTEFQGRLVHGMLLSSLFSMLVGMKLPGERCLYLGQDLAFRRPVKLGQTVTASAKVISKNAGTRTLVLTTEIRDDQGGILVSGTAKVKVRGDVSVTVASDLPPLRQTGRVALVTGGSRGVGASIAQILGEDGWVVAVNYLRNQALAENTVKTISNAGGSAFAVQADVRDYDAVTAMIKRIVDVAGGIDAVVNCAVGSLHAVPAAELEWSRALGFLETQVRGVLQTCQAAYPYLKKSGEGAIVNVLSQVVHGRPPIQMADYVAAKYALKGLSKALAAEWASSGIRVNTVSPGLMRTELTEHYQERIFKMEANRTPLRRLGEPVDTARAVAFLLSTSASFVTGVDFPLTGGQEMS